jgi:DNA-directed RNA polymerase specialized sigma24 family protein
MNKEWVLTQEDFDRLLVWLNPESREEAGRKYEEIRCRLIKIFSCRGCTESDVLSDETINRVTRKLGEIEADWTGDPALYFYGVAQRVHLEYLRKRPHTVVPQMPLAAATVETDETEADEYECLEHCMQRLAPLKRKLLLQYYQEERQAKIDNRKRLAEQLGIALNALRIRAHRIRLTVQQCVQECLAERAAG